MNSSIYSDIRRGLTERLKTFALGGGFALLVLLILAWLQPVGVQEERTVAPQFRFKVAQKRAAKAPPRKPPKQEPKRREVKREESKPQKKTLTRKTPQRRTTTPRKASSLRTGARSEFSRMNLMAGLGGAGAGTPTPISSSIRSRSSVTRVPPPPAAQSRRSCAGSSPSVAPRSWACRAPAQS